MRFPLLTIIALALGATGCSTINWEQTGEAWHDSLCREERNGPCPEADPASPLPNAPGDL